MVRNDTGHTFQLRTRVDERHLRGELLADSLPAHSFRVEARDEMFLRHEDRIFRRNEIWRTTHDRRTGSAVGEELVKRNCAPVKYVPEDVDILEV